MRDLGKAGKSSTEDARVLRDYLEQFSSIPFLTGKRAYGTMLSGTQTLAVPHSLGRPYTGAFQTGTGLPGVVVTAYTAAVARDAGFDPAKFVLVLSSSAPAANTAFEIWCW